MHNYCPNCGYYTDATDDEICPDCGHRTYDSEADADAEEPQG